MLTKEEQIAFNTLFEKEYAPKIGLFLYNWGQVEQMLIFFLAFLLGTDETRGKMVFAEVISLSSKLKLMRRIIHCYYSQSPHKAALLKLIGDTQELGSTRDFYAHASWGYNMVNG